MVIPMPQTQPTELAQDDDDDEADPRRHRCRQPPPCSPSQAQPPYDAITSSLPVSFVACTILIVSLPNGLPDCTFFQLPLGTSSTRLSSSSHRTMSTVAFAPLVSLIVACRFVDVFSNTHLLFSRLLPPSSSLVVSSKVLPWSLCLRTIIPSLLWHLSSAGRGELRMSTISISISMRRSLSSAEPSRRHHIVPMWEVR